MDKISSYPIRFLEALPGRIKLGPSAQWLGKPITLAPFTLVGWPMAQKFAVLNIFETAPISQNKIAPFFQKTKLHRFSKMW